MAAPLIRKLASAVVMAAAALFASRLCAGDHLQFGEAWSRNMISDERGLPERFDPSTGENIVWTAALGTEAHSTPVVGSGRVLIGTNNGRPRDPRHSGDRGVLMCFSERNGQFLWQLVIPKRTEDDFFDWPNSGIASTATIEGDRAYVVDNRGVVLCLDLHGMADGNDGPFRSESVYYAPQPTNELAQGAPACFFPDGSLKPGTPAPARIEPGSLDADIVWMFDLTSGAGIWSHDAAHSSVLIHGNHLYLNTGTGVDRTHRKIRRPGAPSLVVLDKLTGRYLARDNEDIAPDIFHSTWAPPSMGTVAGKDLIFFGAGNGRVYAFKALSPTQGDEAPAAGAADGGTPVSRPVLSLQKTWEFNFDPSAPKTEVHRFHLNKESGPSNFYGAPVFHDRQLYVAGGGDLWWGKNAAWLKCLDVSGSVPQLKWESPLVRHTFSTPSVQDDLVYVTDCSQNLHCMDAGTGRSLWVQELNGETWASPLVADGKVYVGTRRGAFYVLAAGRTRQVISETLFGGPISATAVAANGRLYVTTMSDLYAIAARR